MTDTPSDHDDDREDLDDEFDADDDQDDEDDDAGDDRHNRVPGATAATTLEYIVRALVDDPDSVTVDAIDQRRKVRLEVRVAPGDMGRVIGRRGRTAQTIRTLVRAAAVKDRVEVDVEFED